MHGFCDASASAYGAVIYLVEIKSRKSVVVTSKSKVSPLKSTSIPRLELLGAVVLSRLIGRVKNALSRVVGIESVNCWTDSMVVLHWLNGGKDLKQFVKNRIKTIMEKTEGVVWRHCPGKENPADLLSRGITSRLELYDGRWFCGPKWLGLNSSHWPEQKLMIDTESERLIREEVKVSKTLVSQSISKDLIDSNRFSKYDRLVRSVAWVFRFVHNVRKGDSKKHGRLAVDEFHNAELLVLRNSQLGLDSGRLNDLEKSLKVQLNEDGLLETIGRLEEASSCSRILIPRKSHLATLLVMAAHEKVKHLGTAATLSELRSRFWITQGRQFVKKTLRNCFVCIKAHGKCFSSPEEGALPSFRVAQHVSAFENVGLDYLGPLYVRNRESRQEHKIWVALFTCATSRAIHLEIVNNMSTDAFLSAFRRFCGRRGTPSLLVSDNAKTFVAAHKYLLKLSKDSTVLDHLSSLKIQWKFILEKSPWWGGFWERMVKLTKDALKKTLGKAQVCLEGLHTVLVEIEAVMNSRPLTYVGADDSRECLTPSHLVCGKRIISLPSGTRFSENLHDNYHHLIKVLSDARERWFKEYLTELRCYHCHQKKDTKHPEVGDLVLVSETKTKRQNWKVGKVTKLIIGRKGIVRGAEVKMGVDHKTVLRRPLELLYPLEAQGWGFVNFSGTINEDTTVGNNEISSGSKLKCPSSVSVGDCNQLPTVPAKISTRSLAPVSESSVPASISSCTVSQSPVPERNSSCPVSHPSVPASISSCPVSHSSVPDRNSSCPVSQSSVPAIISSCPVSHSSVPVSNSSCPVSHS